MLVFFVGLFALSGLFAADAKIVATDVGVSSSWSSASWVDSNGNSVQAPINNGDYAILNAMNGAITLTLENDLTITDLFVYGEKGVTIDLNNHTLTVSTIFIGSGPGHDLITTDEANCLGNLTFKNGSVVTNIMNTTSYGDPAKTPNLTEEQRKNVLTIGEGVTSFSVNNCWYVGDYTEAQITNPGNAQLNITRNIDGAPNFVKVLSDQLTTLGIQENVFYWTDSTNDNSWNKSGNWKDKEGNAVSRYPSEMGDIAVFENTSDITITSFTAEENSTIYLRSASTSTGTVTFQNMNDMGSRNLFTESGKYVLNSQTYSSVSVSNGAVVTFTGGNEWVTFNRDLKNEGTVNIETPNVTVNGNVNNSGTINLNTNNFKMTKNYYGNGTIKSAGGTFHADVENNDTSTYEPVRIKKLELQDGTNYSIYLQTQTNREIHLLENDTGIGTIQIDNVTLPAGNYEEIQLANQTQAKLTLSGDVTVNTISGEHKNIYVGKNTLSFSDIGNLSIYVTNGSTLNYIGENKSTTFNSLNFDESSSGDVDFPITLRGAKNWELTINDFPEEFKYLILSGNIEIKAPWEKAVTVNKLTIAAEANISISNNIKLIVGNELINNGSLTLNTGEVTTVSNFTNNGKVTQNGTLTINGDFASGNDESTYASVTLAPTGDAVTVSGFGKITTLNSGNNLGGKTINFNDNITITGQNSNLKGSGNENKLNIGGTGAITVNNENAISTQYLNFLSSSSPIVKGNYINVKNSSAPNGIFPAGWIDDKTYIWTGNTSEDLSENSNWKGGSHPLSGDNSVSIIVTKPTESSKPFILETSENRQSKVNFIIEENAEAILPASSDGKSAILDVTGGCTNSGTLTNSGELTFKEILSSSGTITNNNLITIENDFVSTGTIINNGKLFIKGTAKISGTYSGTNDSLYIINQDEERKTVTINSQITIGTLYVAGNVDLELNGAVSVTNFLTNAGDTNFIAHDFTVNIDGSGSLSATSMDFTRASSTDGVIGTYNLNVPVTCSREIKTHSGSVLNIKSNTQTNTLVHSANNANYQTFINVKSNASLTVNETIDLAANANSGASLSVESGATVKAKSIIDTSTFANGEGQIPLTNYGTIEVSESIDLTTISNFGTITTPTINTSSITNSGTISVETAFTATNYLRPTDSTSDVVNIEEGTTLSIENGTISTLNVEKTNDNPDDFATISSTGTLTISSATYNNADIQTSGTGTIKLANTGDSDTIGKLTIESGELTIENLNVGNLTNKANFSSSTVNITGDLTDNGTSFAGTINFVGTGDQTFTPNTSTTYGDINIEGDGTSASTTTLTNNLKAGIVTIKNNSTFQTNGSGIANIEITRFDIEEGSYLILNGAMVTTSDATTYRGLSGTFFFIFAGTNSITIDQETVQTTAGQVYESPVTLARNTTFEITGNGNALVFEKPITTNGNSLTANTTEGNITFGSENTKAFSDKATVDLKGPATIYGENEFTSITSNDSLTLINNNTVETLSVTTAGGKTLTVNGEISVTTMTLSGTETDKLQIDGSGKFSFTAEPNGNVGTYLKFINKESPMVVIPDKPNGMDILTDSLDHADGTTEFPSGWQEIIGENTRTWEGDFSSDWNDAENWEEGSIPNEESKVVIPVVEEDNNYPVTNETDVISVKSLNVDSGATITLNNTLTATDGITNDGTIKLPNDYTLSCAITNNGNINAENSVVIPDSVQLTNNKNIVVKGNLSIETGATLENNNNSNNRILVYGDLTIAGSYSGDGTISFANHTKEHTITNSANGTEITSLGIVGTQINFVCDLPLTIGTLTKEEGTIYLQSGSLSVGTYSQDSNIQAEENILKLNEGATISFTNSVAFNSVEIINNDDSSVANINADDFTTETLNVYGDFTNANSNAINATTMTVDMNQPNADSDVVIGGNFSVVTFNCKEQGGKNLTLNGMISGFEEMFISGTKNAEIDETNYLTLQGTGSFAYNDSDKTQFVGSYLKFTSDTPTVSQGQAEITSSEHNGTAFPTGWILPTKYTWIGVGGGFLNLGSKTKWENDENWEPNGVPDKNSNVTIETTNSGKYPIFGNGVSKSEFEVLSLKIEKNTEILAADNSALTSFKVHENFTNDGNISNTEDGSSPFAIFVGGNLTNNSTGTINTNSAIEVHGEFENNGTISGSNYSISAYGNVSLLGGPITGYSAFNLINTNSKSSNTFYVDSSYTLPSLKIQQGGFDFNISDKLTIENTLANNGMLNVRKGTLIVPTYEGTGTICVYDGTNTTITDFNGSGDIYLFKGSNLTITNYAGTGTIYLQEGATLTIENATENPNLVIQTTTDETDFATISTNGNLTISSATYNSGDIKTVGNFILPSTESTTNEIGNLLIESGELTIETLHAENITTKETTTLNVENGTITVSENLQNNGSTKAKTLTVKNVENNKEMNVETANVSGDFIDNDSFVVSTINFIGENNQEFLPTSNNQIVYYEINVTKTSGTFTATNPLQVGTLNLESPENNFGEVVANFVNLTNAGNTTFEGNVTCNQTLTITKATQTTFNESVQITSLSTNANSGNITFKKGGTISTATEILSTGDVTLGEDSTFIFGAEDALADFTHTEGTTFIYGTIKAANITLAASEINGNITTGDFVADDCIFDGELNANNVTVTNLNSSTGSVNLNLSGDFTNNGGTVKINKLTLLDSSALTGNLTIGEFIATQSLMTNPDEAKTLTITNKLIVDSMKISGQKDENKITIANSGEIQYSTSYGRYNVGQYIKFDGENPKIANGIGLVAKVEYVNELPDGWEEINTEYIWKGNISDKWETDNNWEFGEAPLADEDAVVIIPSENITNFPVLSETTKIKSLEIKEGATLSVNNNGNLKITETYTNLGTLINAGTVQIDFEANFANSTIQNSGTLNLVGNVDFSQTTYTNDDNNSDKIYITNDDAINSANFKTRENQKAGEIYLKGNITSVELNGNVSFKHLEIENQSAVNTVTLSSSNGGNLQAGSLTNKETLICNTNVTIFANLINDYVIQIPQGISLSANTYSTSSPFATSDRKVILSEGGTLTIGNQESVTSTIAKIEFVKTPETDFATISTNGNLIISATVYKINDESVDIKTSGNGTIKLPSTESTTNEIGNLKIESGKLTIETLHAANITNNGILNATTSVEANNIENSGEITSDTVLATGDLSNDGSMNVVTTNVGGNLTDTGTWAESGIINFDRTSDQRFDSNPATKYAKINVEKSSGSLTINDVLNVTNLQINSNVIFEDTATIENLSIDMSSSEDENFVKFAGEKTYTITTLVGAKGNQNSKLKLASTNDKLWNVYFENKPEIESFEYVEVSKSQSVDENGSVKELNYIEAEENLLSDEECTTIGWFNFNLYYWTGNQSTEWAEVRNWARRPNGNGKFAVAPSKNSSTLKVYVLQTAVNSLIENDELISINLLENPEGKSVELNKGAEIQTIKNAGQIATQESVNVTTFENKGSIFVNAGILTIENYVPTSAKINIKEGAALQITKAEETTISDLTFEKTDSSTEDFASLLGNISVTSATYSEADIQTNGTIKLPSTESTTNEIGNLLIGSGNLTIETLHVANLTNDGTLSTKTITVTENITNNGTLNAATSVQAKNITNDGSMNVATTNVGGNLNDNGTWAESGIVNFVGANDQSFDSNPVTTYVLINVEKSSGILTLANDLNAKDFVLKGGDLFINKTLTTQRDVILLGKKYSIKDSVTNVDLFDYKGEVEFEILDATLLGARVQLADDASIFVGKNFYANGIDISGGKIFIPKPINFAPFAQSFNGEISNNKAICSCADCETEPNQTHAKIMAVGCVDKGENSGWDFDDATILKAQTVRDDVIKVFVNQPLAKISDENLSEFKFIIDDELNGSFQGIYSDVDCTQVFEDEIGTFDQTENAYYFFLKATSKWNTDASGNFAGNVLSTASDNLHYNSIPVIDIPRYTQEKGVIVKNKWGKPFANLSSRFFNGSLFVNVSDNCGPVLVEVKTGQEVHNPYDEVIGQSSQPSYDAHNFIEFEYSEPIIFKGNAYSSLDENILVTSEFGQTDSSNGTLKINGLASFQKGKLITQSKDSTIADNQVNAFYRKDEYSFRFSVAGLTNGTIEYNSNEYKNWIGYIEEAEIPSGTVTLEFDSEGKNPFIQDLQLNHQEKWTSAPKLVVDSSFVGDFGTWDLSSPNFAFHVSENKQIDWYEFVGNGDGFIKNIEFHLFDNDLENNPSVYDGAFWQTREGWLNQAGVLKIPESYAADIFGGSRPFITDEQNRTAGGIRLSSVYNTFENFKYSYGQIAPESFVSFDANVSAALFQSSSHDKTRISNGADSLYFALGITEIGLPLKTTFSISYTSTDTLVVTDLAGNKLKDVQEISSYDVTPPSFAINVVPHNSDEIYMLFSEQINFADFEVKLSDNSFKTYNLMENISNVFEFGHIVDGHWQTIQDLKVESIKERKVFDAHTEIVLKLNQKLKFEQIQQIYIRVAKGLDNTVDVVTGSHNANVTLIQDDKGNYMMQYMAHPISDFAVDVLNLNYAYNSDIANPSASDNLDATKEQKSRVVHDWSRTQANFGTLLLNHDITFNGTILAESIADTQMIFSSSPEKESVASFYNEWTKKDSRIWLAEIPGFESLKFDSWSKENNSSVQFVPSEKENDSITFDILKEQIPDVTSLSFLFALKDANSEYLTVNHYPAYNYSTKMYDLGQKFPLFALRLDNKEDVKSFDLWSLKLDSISLQRGGVTILNNVINPLLGDKSILKLDLAQKARVNILVMTLDGNIVKYLNRGSLDSGEYQFTWDGTNNSGKPVARGMYFIRVFGHNIDETRKVLVVK